MSNIRFILIYFVCDASHLNVFDRHLNISSWGEYYIEGLQHNITDLNDLGLQICHLVTDIECWRHSTLICAAMMKNYLFWQMNLWAGPYHNTSELVGLRIKKFRQIWSNLLLFIIATYSQSSALPWNDTSDHRAWHSQPLQGDRT